jgi:hypothetical protein
MVGLFRNTANGKVSRLCQVRRRSHRVERGANGRKRCRPMLRVSRGSAPEPPRTPYPT